jgi:hypothetical protein
MTRAEVEVRLDQMAKLAALSLNVDGVIVIAFSSPVANRYVPHIESGVFGASKYIRESGQRLAREIVQEVLEDPEDPRSAELGKAIAALYDKPRRNRKIISSSVL